MEWTGEASFLAIAMQDHDTDTSCPFGDLGPGVFTDTTMRCVDTCVSSIETDLTCFIDISDSWPRRMVFNGQH